MLSRANNVYRAAYEMNFDLSDFQVLQCVSNSTWLGG